MCDLSICRICLNTNVRGYKMDEYGLRESYEHILWAKVNSKDGLPLWLCYECVAMFQKFHKFKEKCLRGQAVLKRLLRFGNITYEAVGKLNRYNENVASTVCLFVKNPLTKTITVKHVYNPELMEVEKVLLNLDTEDHMKQEHDANKLTHKLNKNKYKVSLVESDDAEDDKKLVELINIKSELPLTNTETLKDETQPSNSDTPFADIRNTNNDTSVTNNDIISTNNDFENINDDMGNTDHIDNDMSSDDENIFLDIVKKAVKGENELVFLDNIEMEPKVKKKKYVEDGNGIRKAFKFTKPKKELLNPQYWRKYNLNEEDAMQQFKQLEFSDKYVNANYKCHTCFKGFSKMEMLLRHVKFRHEESGGPIECRFCHMRFRQKNKLCKHVKQHYSVFHCLRCDMRFRLENSAIFHEDYHNGVIRKCKHCGEEFKHSSTYYTHLRMAHRSAHLCTMCGASFVSNTGLRQHKRIKHYENSEDAFYEATPAAPAAESTYCEKCDIKFLSRAAYDEHLTHTNLHDDLIVEPEIKRKNMKGNRKLSSDEPRRKKPTTCQYCGKNFRTQSLCMKHHLAEHPRRAFYPPDQRHICEVCGVSLAAVSIASHMNRHTREHVYPCAVCGMQFISKSSHHRHQVTHTGERPYPCPLCEKRFTQKNSMQLHYRTFHLKEPYPKRNRRKKTDEMPITECPVSRDTDSNDAPPARWRPPL